MRKYWVTFKLYLEAFLEYRADVAIYTLSNIVAPMIGLFVWLAVAANGGVLGYSQQDLIIYFLAAALVSVITITWGVWFIESAIGTGKFATYQIKPYSLLMDYLMLNVSEKVYQLVMAGVAVSLVVIAFGLPIFKIISLVSFVLFVLSSIAALFIAVFIDLSVGLIYVWSHDTDFLRNTRDLLEDLFSGKVVPIIFLPLFLKGIAFYLPFRYMLSFPIEVLLNKLSFFDLIIGFGMQSFWLVLVFVVYRFTYSAALKSYQGYNI